MNIGILGTGMVGRTLAARLVELGHEVALGTRSPEASLARTETGSRGNIPLGEWLAQNPAVRFGTFAEAAAHGEIVINATSGAGSIAALQAAGKANLRGKVLIDLANPLDGSQGFPPTLFVSNTDSLAEQIQRTFPDTRVVKTLNTMNTAVMTDPCRLAEGQHTVFLSGNDPQAKAQVRELLRSFGWEDILDLGDISTARGVEMYLPLWLRMMGALGTAAINIKVVR